MFKNTRLYSIIFNKCPRCHKGQFFKTNNPYDFRKFSDMNKQCDHCHESFTRETGFYYGAMYISYGLNIGLGLTLFLLMVVLSGIDTTVFLFTFLGISLLLFPWTFRKARLVWINLFVRYKKDTDKQLRK